MYLHFISVYNLIKMHLNSVLVQLNEDIWPHQCNQCEKLRALGMYAKNNSCFFSPQYFLLGSSLRQNPFLSMSKIRKTSKR